jgi:tetratricopeptide (TPR) repeat protein
VHASRFSVDGDSPYIQRQADALLAAALTENEKRLVIVEGPRLAGTTRTLAAAALAHLPDHLVAAFVDDPRIPLTDMIDQASRWADDVEEAAGVVVWFERLSPERFTEVACFPLETLPSGVLVLATFDSAEREGLRVAEQVSTLSAQQYATRIEVGAITGQERADLLAEDCYAVLRPILEGGQDAFLGRLMIAWEPLRAALTCGRTEQSDDQVALLRAITDWGRARVPRLLTADILSYLYRAYRRETAGTPDDPVSMSGYSEALQWATAPPSSDHPRLVDEQAVPGGQGYFAYPLLAVIADDPGEDASWPVSNVLWTYADTYLDGEQRRDVGYCALARGARHAAARLLDHDDIAVDPDAYGQLGLLFYANAEWADSRKWWQKAVSADHGDHIAGTMINLAVLEGRQGNPEQARHWYQQVIKIGHPDTAPWAMYNLGALEEKQGHPEQARHWYRQAIETRHPNYAPISMVNLAVLEGLQGNPEEARHWYGQAIQSGHPEQAPKAVFGLGLLDMETGNQKRARRYFHQTIKTGHPDYGPSAMASLGVLAEDERDLGQARRWYRKAIETGHLEHAPKAMLNLAVLEAAMGNVEQARDLYEQVIESGQPEATPRALFALGNLEDQQGDPNRARSWYRRAIAMGQPDTVATAMTNLGNLEGRQGNLGEARRLYQQAIETRHPDAAPKAMMNLGSLEAQIGNLSQARHWYQKAAATSHTDIASSANQELRALDQADNEQQRARAFGLYGYLAYADPALMKQDNRPPGTLEPNKPDHKLDPR